MSSVTLLSRRFVGIPSKTYALGFSKCLSTKTLDRRRNVSSKEQPGIAVSESSRRRTIQHHFSTNSSASLISSDNIVRSPIPDMEFPMEPFHSLIFRKCDEFKDSIAVTEYLTGKSYTYSQIKENAIKVASALHKKGFRKNDVVLAFTSNNCDFSVLMLACSLLGVWFSAANPAFTPTEFARQVEHSEAKAVFTIPPLVKHVKEALGNPEFSHIVKSLFVFGESPGFQPFQTLLEDDGKSVPDVDINPMEDVCVLPYSSGTTGLPKGVMLTHHNCEANTLQIEQSMLMERQGRILCLLPLYHIYGMMGIQFGTFMKGASLHCLPQFEPETFLRCIQDSKITFAPLVPPLIVFLTKHPLVARYDLSSVSHVVIGAAPLGPGVSEEFLKKFPGVKHFNQAYGLTETTPGLMIDTRSSLGSIGPLLANTLGKIVDPDSGKVLGVGEVGELVVKGPQIMKGYFKNQEATDDMIKDGWLYTGDIACFDNEGMFSVKDRLKELIKYKGNQVAPAELEAILLGHPDVQDVAVIGIPDEEAGELPKAYVVKKPGSTGTEDNICKFVEDNVARTKKLRGGVQFVEEIPKNPSGKILRRILKAKYVQ